MDEQIAPPPDTVTFKRTHFYTVMVVIAFCAGILVGYMAWGRGSRAVAAQPAAQQPQAAAPTYRRYDIPTEGSYSLGPQDAPITIVEFSDYQCPFCVRWHDQVYEQLMAAYPGKIRFVYRHLPLTSIHPEALPAAEAAMCAGEQNAYWQYHERLFANQQSLGENLYDQIAADIGRVQLLPHHSQIPGADPGRYGFCHRAGSSIHTHLLHQRAGHGRRAAAHHLHPVDR